MFKISFQVNHKQNIVFTHDNETKISHSALFIASREWKGRFDNPTNVAKG